MTSRPDPSRDGCRDPLRRLAAAWGIEPSYRDNAGVEREADPGAVIAVLEAMGAPIGGDRDLDRAFRESEASESERLADTVVVAWEGRLPAITVARRGRAASGKARWGATIELEDGGCFETPAREAAGTAPARGGDTERPRIELDPPEPLPFGLHRLRLDLGAGATASVHVLSAPVRCWDGEEHDAGAKRGAAPRRRLGLFAPVHALRSQRSRPAVPGDLTDLARLRDWVVPLGVDVVGVLPLLASFLDEPFDPSPYAPVSRLFWNELYLDLALSPELERSPRAAALLEEAAKRVTHPAATTGSGLVDYRETIAAKRRVLEELADTAFAEPSRRREIEELARDEPWLDDYARFRAVAEQQRAGWPAWPDALRGGAIGPDDFDQRARRYHLYAQWLWDRQFRSLFAAGEALYLDLPIGVNGGGFDVWRFRDQFAPGASVGAPPDMFFAAGQDWGFPPPHPRHGRDTGHAYFRSVVRAQLRRAGMLRLDHVMALHRLFWIPRGGSARQGVYVRYPAEELYAILAIESHRHRALVVGENLGTVPPEVHEGMRRHGLLPMRILQFELSPEWPRESSEPTGLAALNTHDTATFAAFWEARDVELRVRLGLLEETSAGEEAARRKEIRRAVIDALRREGWLAAGDATPEADSELSTGAVLHALLRRLAASAADVVVVQLEDLWLEREPQNVPGMGDEFPSWRRAMRRTLESIAADSSIEATLRELAALRAGARP
ncbi:MAG TPA: 4-alpha-glucanotransferase [Thermoanaerobaculia bacterium]|nr:4-alpha-glucanotransferase [Thermoanaerobaculia bacterium]